MGRLRVFAALFTLCPLLTGCSADDKSKATTQAPTPQTVIALTDDDIAGFAGSYRYSLAERDIEVPAHLRKDAPGSHQAFKALILRLCALDAPDRPTRRVVGHRLKDEPEFFGDAAFAADQIESARVFCDLEG